ncbi:MAG: hypothetical protein LKJ69_01090 [Lactobacillus sp.]|jgi:hypothetical protein|nr:hypothetical protein [Lactobacillus sp.]MCI2031978.1 hypothetical protein [Lactobacillus sp.]
MSKHQCGVKRLPIVEGQHQADGEDDSGVSQAVQAASARGRDNPLGIVCAEEAAVAAKMGGTTAKVVPCVSLCKGRFLFGAVLRAAVGT